MCPLQPDQEPAVYVLPTSDAAARGQAPRLNRVSLSPPLLRQNALWFCRFRWAVVAVLLGVGLLSRMFGGALRELGLSPPGLWIFVTGALLGIMNLWYPWRLRTMPSPQQARNVVINLWTQIVLDLLVLTACVHFIGSLQTSVAICYIWHIVLSCIFLRRRDSFIVLSLAIVLYASCILLELGGVLPRAGVFATDSRPQLLLAFNAGLCVLTWFIVWYLCSLLAQMVRHRDAILAATNRRLIQSQQERSRHMLVTTHQLKAPFAAIHAYTQVLLEGHCGPLPPEAVDVVGRMESRCRRLADNIQEMLQLANLRSSGQAPLKDTPLDIAEVIRWCAGQLAPLAAQKQVKLNLRLQPAVVEGVEDHLKMLFMNLMANAVNYSRPSGSVWITCGPDGGGAAAVIKDEGIGIAPESLPRIFEEYFRTTEAVRHNRESSGLGLAIVKQVVQLHRIGLSVRSAAGAGTSFALQFSAAAAATEPAREVADGESHDY